MDHDIVTSDVTLYVKWVKKGAPVTLAATEAKTESSKTGDHRAVAAIGYSMSRRIGDYTPCCY